MERLFEFWKNPPVTTSEELDDRLAPFEFPVHFAYHSGKIENERISYRDTKSIFERDAVVGYTGDLRTLYETRNLRDAWNWMRDQVIKKTPVTESFILDLHRITMRDCYDRVRSNDNGEEPGTYKKRHYVVGPNETGAHPDDAREEMQNLLDEIADFITEVARDDDYRNRSENKLSAVAYFHCRFENIHPFADGNGRVGRLLLNYLLMALDLPPLNIAFDTREQYYEALERYNTDEEIAPMKNFLVGSMERTWRHILKSQRPASKDQYVPLTKNSSNA